MRGVLIGRDSSPGIIFNQVMPDYTTLNAGGYFSTRISLLGFVVMPSLILFRTLLIFSQVMMASSTTVTI
jgi:hypothetical protein